jgi:polar amino acid transport system ATP-binding protein
MNMSTSAVMTPLVRAVDVRKSFGEFHALQGITLDIAPGEVLCVIGPSGSGKSTFLRCINQLETVSDGALWVGGELVGFRRVGDRLHALSETEIARQRLKTGMVFQRFNLFPHMTVLENIVLAPKKVKGTGARDARLTALELLQRIGLSDKADEFPDRLSGGQQQRVAIARALAMGPELMLLDEITSALDPQLVADVLNLVRGLAETGMTMIIATHEMSFAREVADKVCFLDAGVICEEGPPERIFSTPDEPRTREFLSRVIEAGRL